ncbi:MAG: Right handed beta helix region, partial [Verrucomicrobiaceae bacterium]|nr:Right handed beta helix region [Verrucomicrobiaceae bacterium]
NHITNNIFAFGQLAQLQRSRPEKHASFDFDHNIVYYTEPKLLDGSWYNWEPGTFEMHSNLYWNAAGLPVTFIDTDLAGWQKKTGRDDGSLVADPLFLDAAKRDFTLEKGSPALKLGFKPFDPAEAGVRPADAAWHELAASLKIRDWEANSKPWPAPEFSLKQDFEFMSLGIPALPRTEIQWENKGDKIEVTEEQAFSGKRSLKFLDAPNLDRAFDPHLIIKPKYKEGTATCAFAFRFEPGAQFSHEWRDSEKPYGTGPSLTVQGGKLSLGHGKPVLDLQPNTWVRFEITAALGDKAGKWSIKVTLADGSVKMFADLPTKPGWGVIDWMGFVSDAKEKTTFFIDDLSISRVP